MQTKTRLLKNVGDVEQFGIEGDFIEIVEAVGNLTVIHANADGEKELKMVKGDSIKITKGYNALQISSDVAGDSVTYTCGFGWGQRLSIPPFNVSGPQDPFTKIGNGPGGFPVVGKPLIGGMVKDNGDGTFTIYPMTTDDGFALKVNEPYDQQLGYIVQSAAAIGQGFNQIDVRAWGTLRMKAVTVGNAPLFIYNSLGDPMAAYSLDGNLVEYPSIPVADAGNGFIVPLPGGVNLSFVTAGTDWTFHCSLSARVFVPRKP